MMMPGTLAAPAQEQIAPEATLRREPAPLDALSAHWRLALNLAEDTLSAAVICGTSLRFPEQEMHVRQARLAHERAQTARLLDEIAQDERVKLYHRVAAPRATRRAVGLSDDIEACVFELDGVLTASRALHAAAWADTFDELLTRRFERTGEQFAPYRPFDRRTDYLHYIDGKPRLDGIHAFLASRGIRLTEGHPSDPPDAETVHGLANRKNDALRDRLDREGVTAFAGARAYLEAAREAGVRCAVVSASANTNEILDRAGLAALIEQRVDGNTMRTERLRPKPAPDTLLAACHQLGTSPSHAAAFETTLAGRAAAHTAGVRTVIAIEPTARYGTRHQEDGDVVVPTLATLLDAAQAR
jgi:beta-phosphoglucomutase family hydrolase